MVAHYKQYSGSNHHSCSPGLMKLTLFSHSTLNLACLPSRLNTAVRMILFKGKSDHGILLLKTFFKLKSLQTLHKLIILTLISPSKLHNGLLASPETLALVVSSHLCYSSPQPQRTVGLASQPTSYLCSKVTFSPPWGFFNYPIWISKSKLPSKAILNIIPCFVCESALGSSVKFHWSLSLSYIILVSETQWIEFFFLFVIFPLISNGLFACSLFDLLLYTTSPLSAIQNVVL